MEQKLDPLLDMMRKRHGIMTSLSPVFKMRSEVLQGSPAFLDMLDDARLLYDRDRFFRRYLEALRELKQFGRAEYVIEAPGTGC